jgi:predicted Rossmann fold nucleotide-binding protein DprA/Smf involved in DNA uptake
MSDYPAHTQAVLLLCGHFGQLPTGTSPLTLTEYNGLARALHARTLRPEALFDVSLRADLALEVRLKGGLERLNVLLGRGVDLAFALDGWTREGLWVSARGDTRYPARLRSVLRDKAPVLLFGIGDVALLRSPALAVVGSRDASPEVLEAVSRMGREVASAGWSVVSGGARGVDLTAMQACLEAGGTAVGYLPEGIAKPSRSGAYRTAVREGRLVLLSPFTPYGRWSAANAMARNKLIHAHGTRVVVASSGTDGGTWTGALENLKAGWSPLHVLTGGGLPDGNAALVREGGLPLPIERLSETGWLDALNAPKAPSPDPAEPPPQQLGLFGG